MVKKAINKLDDGVFESTFTYEEREGMGKDWVTVTFTNDLDADQLGYDFWVPHAKVVWARRCKNGTMDPSNKNVKLSELMVTAPRGQITVSKAATVISALPIVERVKTMFDMDYDEEVVQLTVDKWLEKGKITSEEHEEACDTITEISNL